MRFHDCHTMKALPDMPTGPLCLLGADTLGLLNVGGLKPLWSIDDIKRHSLTFSQ